MQRCWENRQENRPDADTVLKELKVQQELGDETWHSAATVYTV